MLDAYTWQAGPRHSPRFVHMSTLYRAKTDRDWEIASDLFVEYAESLDFDLRFQSVDAELSDLRRQYSPPTGCMLLAQNGLRTVGCVALRDLGDGVCEMKRLYVMPEARGLGYGRRLVLGIIEEARERNYDRIRLDTVPEMRVARSLYSELGFRSIEPYRQDPVAGAEFLELHL